MLLTGNLLSAGVLDKRDFLISQDYSHTEQNNPSIAVGLDGKFAVVWVDYRSGNGDIYCRLFDSGAVEIGSNFELNDDDAGAWQIEPDLSSDWYGNYFAVWKDYRNNMYPFDPDIYYQRMDSAGFIGTNQNITLELPDSSHQSPAIGATGWGKTVITWTDLRHLNWDVFVQSLDTDGNPIGTNYQVNDDNSATPQHGPEVALSSEGWFVVVWYDGRNGNDDVYLQKYDSTGDAIGGNIRINDDGTSAKQKFPSVAIGGNGVIFVVWSDWRNGSYPHNPDVYGQRLDNDLNRLGGNILINMDGAQTAQRDPKVASDRMGNTCVVWSDSLSLDWDVKCQMFEYTGIRHEANFSVNLDSEGKQLHPDVALDGYFSYFTWADDRSGNYDIYGRLLQYNDPSLIASPTRVDLSKDKYEPDPKAVKILLTNAGYGELDYRMEADQDWIILSKSTGATPDSFYLSVNSNGLDYGMYQGRVKLIDIQHNDSTAFLPVILTITGPLLDINPDSITFKALAEIGPPSDQTIIIDNAGSGELNFTLTTTTDWLTLNKTTGADGEVVRAGCDISILIAGEHHGYIIAEDNGALNSPESLHVFLNLQTNMPYLASLPATINKNFIPGESVSDSIRVINLGSSVINWQAEESASWVTIHNHYGQDNDVVNYTITTASLDPGTYTDSIIIEDSLAFNNPLIVPVELTVTVYDTVVIPTAQAEQGGQFQTPLYLHSHNFIRSGLLCFTYDTSMLKVDSLGPPLGGDAVENRTVTVDSIAGAFTVAIPDDTTKPDIDPGYYHLGDIYATASDSRLGTTVFEAAEEIDSFIVETADGNFRRPILNSGDIEISIPSSVYDMDEDFIPNTYYLGQNSPNPFNGATLIKFGLRRSSPVRLEVFNILGQRVKLLMDDYLPAGHHSTSWDGKDQHGTAMATGIYFYRLISANFGAVRKMVYLK